MKRFFWFCAVITAVAGTGLGAQEGYSGPGAEAVTVAAAKELRDDTPVILRGKIERFLGDERYLFSDETGSVVVEIDDRLWRGISADQNDTVEITGTVDRDFRKVEIEADRIKKL
jgi:uncharacterized protein (TIGR00156 family)